MLSQRLTPLPCTSAVETAPMQLSGLFQRLEPLHKRLQPCHGMADCFSDYRTASMQRFYRHRFQLACFWSHTAFFHRKITTVDLSSLQL